MNLKTEKHFTYATAGASLGVTFFNGMSINAGAACPYNQDRFDRENMFVNIGFDIPIIEYLAALKKNK